MRAPSGDRPRCHPPVRGARSARDGGAARARLVRAPPPRAGSPGAGLIDAGTAGPARRRPSGSARRLRLLLADRLAALAGRLGLRDLPVHMVPVEVGEEGLDVLLAPVGGGAEVPDVGVLVDVD